jgi:hypothetical protein
MTKRSSNARQCGDTVLIGCFAHSGHSPDDDYYRSQIEMLFQRGFIDEQTRRTELKREFDWQHSYCSFSWYRLETVFRVLGAPRWMYAPINEVKQLGNLPTKWWGGPRIFLLNLWFRLTAPRLMRPVVSRRAVRRFKARQRSRYSPTCRTNLALYFESVIDLEAEVELPQWFSRLLREEGLGGPPEVLSLTSEAEDWAVSEVRASLARERLLTS